jgi:hypothetical protein
MNDFGCYGDCCDNCIEGSYDLIDSLVKDIKHLESKVVYLRYALSKHLSENDGKMLMVDIFSDLSGPHWDNPLYQQYMTAFHDGLNPLDNGDLSKYLKRIMRSNVRSNL